MVEKVNGLQAISALDMEKIRFEQEKQKKEEIALQKLEIQKEKKELLKSQKSKKGISRKLSVQLKKLGSKLNMLDNKNLYNTPVSASLRLQAAPPSPDTKKVMSCNPIMQGLLKGLGVGSFGSPKAKPSVSIFDK